MARRRAAKAGPYRRSESIDRRVHAQPYDPFAQRLRVQSLGSRVPVTRPLKVYTQDPGTPRMDVAVGDAEVSFEPLAPGPEGRIVRVIDVDESRSVTHPPLDLDRLGVFAPTGLTPSTGNPQFAQQMTYAAVMMTYDRFRQALGRIPDFSFGPARKGEPDDHEGVTLHVYPHGMEEDNAYYDPERGALLFGYTVANARSRGLNQAGDVFTSSLSHDVVVHEATHAMLDGMRAKFMLPSNGDVDAFHEGFADLSAIFQRFQYRELVRRAISQASDLTSSLLSDVMRQWGQATGDDPRSPVRSALVLGGPDDEVPKAFRYRPGLEAHDKGAILVAAVFDAFRWIFVRKTAPLMAVAPRSDRVSSELVDLLTGEAVRLARQFLTIVIRAVDYCPPVDLTYGEYLRAMVTADFDLVPEDPWGYREALVQAFRRYGITVDGVRDLSEESLLWRQPERELAPIRGLSFSELQHQRPGQVADPSERQRRADVLGAYITEPAHLEHFGLLPPRRAGRRLVDAVVVESVRALRRIGPDGTVNSDLVAEVTQRRRVGRRRWFYGGATIIIDAVGCVRYAIVKGVGSTRREERARQHLAKKPAIYGRLFDADRPQMGSLLRHLHRAKRG